MEIKLTDEQASALRDYLECGDVPDYWTTPLAPVQQQLSEWYRTESPA